MNPQCLRGLSHIFAKNILGLANKKSSSVSVPFYEAPSPQGHTLRVCSFRHWLGFSWLLQPYPGAMLRKMETGSVNFSFIFRLLSHYGTFIFLYMASCIVQASSHLKLSPQGPGRPCPDTWFRKCGLLEQHHPDFPVDVPKPLRLHTRKHRVNKVYFLICELPVLCFDGIIFLKTQRLGMLCLSLGQILGLVSSLSY